MLVLPSEPHDQVACPPTARREAWEDRDPGSIRVLLSNPRWERRLLRFLEPSGAGRIMGDGRDEEEARAALVDEWICVGGGEGRAVITFFPLPSYNLLGGLIPRTAQC